MAKVGIKEVAQEAGVSLSTVSIIITSVTEKHFWNHSVNRAA